MTTPLTEQQIADNVAAVKANLEGKLVQYWWLNSSNPEWKAVKSPLWSFDDTLYRPAPTLATRWWNKPEDVPGPVCWIRAKETVQLLVTRIESIGVTNTNLFYKWEELETRAFEYSLNRKTWQPCTVTEEAK